jgi:threonine dehydrogenase-like Zn-dependent dehydrogenase
MPVMTGVMTGVCLPGDSTVQHVKVDVPEPGHGQVLLRMKASSICGSDIRTIYREHLGTGPEAYQGVIAGHEPCGQVVAVGPGARRLQPGDRVVVYHIAGCGVCEECRAGYMIGCTSPLRAAHGWQRNGGHAEYLLAEEATCILLPEPLTYVDGALVSCGFGTAYEGLLRLQLSGRDRLLITGLGPVGLAAAMLGRALGAGPIIATDVAPERLQMAEDLGLVDHAVPADERATVTIQELTDGRGCEASIDCSGSSAARGRPGEHPDLGAMRLRRRGRADLLPRVRAADSQADHAARLLGDVPAAHGGAARAPGALEPAPRAHRHPPLHARPGRRGLPRRRPGRRRQGLHRLPVTRPGRARSHRPPGAPHAATARGGGE